jgi:hypothetical protein
MGGGVIGAVFGEGYLGTKFFSKWDEDRWEANWTVTK